MASSLFLRVGAIAIFGCTTVTSTTTTTSTTTDSSTLGVDYSIDSDEFVQNLYITIPIGTFLILLYIVLRQYFLNTWELRRHFADVLMEETSDDGGDDNAGISSESSRQIPRFTTSISYPNISTGWFWWMWEVWSMDSNTFYKHAGFDAFVFRLYLKGCLWICVTSMPYALIVLLPIYSTGTVE